MNGDIDKLIKFITEHFSFDERAYPELKEASEEERLAFAIRHSALHFAKTSGKIAAVSERADHGEKIDVGSLKTDIPKSIVNALRLAELVSMTGDEIIKSIEEMYKDKIK